MQVIKPDHIALWQACRRTEDGFGAVVVGAYGFSLSDPSKLVEEHTLLKAAEQLTNGEALEECYRKPQAEFLLYGYIDPNPDLANTNHLISVQVAELAKSITYIPGAKWQRQEQGGLCLTPGSHPLKPVWLRPENAYGGADHPYNPKGSGYAKTGFSQLSAQFFHQQLPHSPNDIGTGQSWACFCPYAAASPWRLQYCPQGFTDQDWMLSAKSAYFMTAPIDQQRQKFFQPGTPIKIQGLPTAAHVIESHLPPLILRIFARQRDKPGQYRIQEFPTQCDTLVLLPNQDLALCYFRSVIKVRDFHQSDLTHVLLAIDSSNLAHQYPFNHFESALSRRLGADRDCYLLDQQDLLPADWLPTSPSIPHPTPRVSAAKDQLAQLIRTLNTPGLLKATDKDTLLAKLPEALGNGHYSSESHTTRSVVTRLRTQSATLQHQALAHQKWFTAQDGMNNPSTKGLAPFAQKIALLQQRFQKNSAFSKPSTSQNALETLLQKQSLTRAKLKAIDITNQHFKTLTFTETEWQKAHVEGCHFTNVHFVKNTYHRCHFSDCIFQDCTFEEATFADSQWSNCRFYDCQWQNTVFNHVQMEGVLLQDNTFTHGKWQGCLFNTTTFTANKFTCHQTELCHWLQSCWRDSIWDHCTWHKARLQEITISHCQFSASDFYQLLMTDQAKIRHAIFQNVSLHKATFLDTRWWKVAFERVDLTQATMNQSFLAQCNITHTCWREGQWQNSSMLRCQWQKTQLGLSSFTGTRWRQNAFGNCSFIAAHGAYNARLNNDFKDCVWDGSHIQFYAW